MRRLDKHILTCLVLGILFWPVLTHAQSVKKITVSFENVSSPPFYYGEEKTIRSSMPGLLVEHIRQAAEMSGVSVEFVRMPWKRVLLSLKAGSIDAAFSASYKTERDLYANYPEKGGELDTSRSLTDQTYVLYSLIGSDRLKWDGSKIDLSTNPIIGTKRGYSIISYLKELGVKIDEATSSEQNLGKVISGRIAAYAGLERMVDAYLKKNPKISHKIKKVSPILKRKPYFLIFNEKFYEQHADLVEEIWDNLATIKATEKYNQLKKIYENIE